jgi:hypothetical protein
MCWFITRHPYAPILRRHGFINSRRSSHFNVQPEWLASEELAFLRAADARIHLTHGDTDVL